MPAPSCPACGKARGSNAECLSCRDAAARELAAEARDVTESSIGARAQAARRFTERPPWYARLGAGRILTRVRLLWMVLSDWASGRYRQVPWRAIAAIAAAAAYVISPIDLIPDFLVPIGWTDDMLVLALAWRMVKRELEAYCAWKGLSPAHFGLPERELDAARRP
jgi:uncharacterized membrane protein YkvA (DUF1232 family)